MKIEFEKVTVNPAEKSVTLQAYNERFTLTQVYSLKTGKCVNVEFMDYDHYTCYDEHKQEFEALDYAMLEHYWDTLEILYGIEVMNA